MSDQARRTIKLGLLQMSMEVRPDRNLSKALRMIARAAKKGANVVCLPELFTTRYFAQYEGEDLSMEERMAFLETIPGKVTDALCKAAPGQQRGRGRRFHLREGRGPVVQRLGGHRCRRGAAGQVP